MTFAYATHAVRVVFGSGSITELAGELDRAGMRRLLLLTTPGRPEQRHQITTVLGDTLAGAFDGARLHVPVEVIAAARVVLDRVQPHALLALGGGSAIGLGKALAFETGLPLAAIPTTYSGSEMTAIWGRSDGKAKQTLRDPVVAPRLVLYDPDLTHGLVPAVSAASGMNAIAHCVEAEYAPDRNPVASFFALEGLRLMARSLPVVVRDSTHADARAECLLAAHYAGRALDLTSMGLEHKLAHILGGSFGLNHAEAHAALVPWVTLWNADGAPEAMANIARALGVLDAGDGLLQLSRTLGIKTLGTLGFTRDRIPEAVEKALSLTFPNPRPVDAAGVTWILEHAMNGER